MPLGVPKKTQKDGKCEITRALKVRPFVKGKKKAAPRVRNLTKKLTTVI